MAALHRLVATIRHQPGQLTIVGATAVSVAGCALALLGLLGIISFLPQLGWRQVACLVVLCGAPQGAIWAGHLVLRMRRLQALITRPMLERRLHGNLDAIIDDIPRSLRPIGTTAAEVAARTGDQLASLLASPNVRIFHGVRAPSARSPLIAHAVVAGRVLILVESVAWPAGHYRTDAAGRISCDGVYIGQSVQPLVTAVSEWRNLLPRHRVCALVVVHSRGPCVLPASGRRDLAWVSSDNVMSEIGTRMCGRQRISPPAIAALLSATAIE